APPTPSRTPMGEGWRQPHYARSTVGRRWRTCCSGPRIGRKLGVVGMREVEINGEPGCVFEDRDGRAIAVVALNIADDQVQTIHAVANPEKLQHLDRSDR